MSRSSDANKRRKRLLHHAFGEVKKKVAAVVSGWNETFDEADFAAFTTKYQDNVDVGASGTWNWSPPDGWGASWTVAGGAMVGAATINSQSWPLSFSAQPFVPDVPQLWMRAQFSIVNHALVDGDGIPIALNGYGLGGFGFQFDSNPDASNTAWLRMFTAAGHEDTASSASVLFGAGAHSIIICVSEPTSTQARVEVWIDKTAGDAADIDHTVAKVAGEGIGTVIVTATMPNVNVATVHGELSLADISIEPGTRASNPFTIL